MGRPSGTVTFLFTDIEGSTRLWEESSEQMRAALARHDELLNATVEEHDGFVFATGGDGFAVAFSRAGDAVACAIDAQRGLREADLPRVRMAMHTGEAEERGGDYFGPTVNRTARLMAITHGGQVILSGSTRELLGPEIAVADLGQHRLRDLSRPEHVFEVVVPGCESEFPPLRSLDSRPGNLPVELTSFVGREEELPRICKVLEENRLVTITGVGGVGKTRLALQVAAELLLEFRDGGWLCELANAQDEGAVGDVVSVALQAPARPGMSLLDSAVEFLRSKRLLLIIDNCEHLLNECGRLIDRVLASCPEIRVLATSREGLGLPGEHLWPLRSLAVPSPADRASPLGLSESERLFVDRATSIDPSFTMDDREAGAVAEICRRLDGIPLAIELAAARVRSLGPTQIAALLNERFRLLTGGRRRSVERHHTLRATVDWSYSLLDEQESAVFERLGVFTGSFDPTGAQEVAGGDGIEPFDVLDALDELVGKSMVETQHHPGATRYQMLETLRQYALEKLDERALADDLRRRHAEYYARFSERIGPLLLGPDEVEWRPRLRQELDNLRSAVGWAIERDNEPDRDLGLRIIAALSRECVLDRGSGIAGWAERAVEVTPESPSSLRPVVMVAASYGAFHRGDLHRADTLAREAQLATRSSDLMVASWAAMTLANVAETPDQSVAILKDALSWVAEGHLFDRYTMNSVYAIYNMLIGEAETAANAAARALEDARMLGQPSALALALYANGWTLSLTDQLEARRACEESLRLTEHGASDIVAANCMAMLGVLSMRAGDVAGALRMARDSIAGSDAVGDRPPISGTLHTAARALVGVAEPEVIATLGGAIYAGWYTFMLPRTPVADRLSEVDLDAARKALSPRGFDEAWEAGAAMSYEELIPFVLSALDRALLDRGGPIQVA